MGKHASMHGVASVFRKWKKDYPHLSESTVRGFRKRYESQLKEASLKKQSPKKTLRNKARGRPPLLGENIDTLTQKFLKETRYKGGVVNSTVAIATATALANTYPLLEKDNITLGRSWAQSIFRCMGFVRRRATTGKVEIPQGAQKEVDCVCRELFSKISLIRIF